jgi:hypothetical protein
MDSALLSLTGFRKRRAPAVRAEAQQSSMMWLDVEANLTIHIADQGIQDIRGDIDHRLAVGALQMSMWNRRCPVGRFGHCEVIDRCRAADVGVSDETKLPECRQSAIDRRPVNSGSRCLRPSNDLIGCQVLFGAVQHLDHGLASPGYPLVLSSEQVQRGLDPRRGVRPA